MEEPQTKEHSEQPSEPQQEAPQQEVNVNVEAPQNEQ